MFINNGATVDAAWTKFIAISTNNVDWETINKQNVKKVMRSFIPNYKSSVANRGYPFNDLAQVIIEFEDGTDIRFDIRSVQNQAGWTGAATISIGLNVAIDDITTWLSS